MKLRKKFWPRTVTDSLGVGFLLLMIPVCFWFEVFVAMPIYFEGSPNLYRFHCALACFILYNLVSNFIAVVLVDSSTRGLMLPSSPKPTWRFCSVCESVSPPRSWHCNTCESCILKRDHHCNFTSCCIGHNNQRYFMVFLFYLSVGTLYCTYFNVYYLWRFTSITSLFSTLKLILPVAVLLLGNDTSLLQVYRIICVISIVGMVATVTLLVYHLLNLIKGMTMYENNKKFSDYDMGSALENIKLALGERWGMALLSPFVVSKLPHDGINWDEIKLSHGKSK